jgi:hypothetical protein
MSIALEQTNSIYYQEGIEITNSEEVGLIRIDTGSGWVTAIPYIDNGSTWQRAIPYIDNGTTWLVCE